MFWRLLGRKERKEIEELHEQLRRISEKAHANDTGGSSSDIEVSDEDSLSREEFDKLCAEIYERRMRGF